MSKYTTAYFINKFEAIPEEEIYLSSFADTPRGPTYLHHCGWVPGNLNDEAKQLLEILSFMQGNPFDINDGTDFNGDLSSDYWDLGDTPKERVINALVLISTGIYKEAL